MIRITRSWYADGRALLGIRLVCDGCGRPGRAYELGSPWTLEPDLARLILRCRRRGWRRRMARTEHGPVRADYCRACARARRNT